MGDGGHMFFIVLLSRIVYVCGVCVNATCVIHMCEIVHMHM